MTVPLLHRLMGMEEVMLVKQVMREVLATLVMVVHKHQAEDVATLLEVRESLDKEDEEVLQLDLEVVADGMEALEGIDVPTLMPLTIHGLLVEVQVILLQVL